MLNLNGLRLLLKKLVPSNGVGGMILTESFIALATLTTSAIAMGMVNSSAISASALSRDYLIAENLMAEAKEVVKNQKATNYLRKPGQKQCWMMLDRNCSTFVQATNYIVVFNNGLFELQETGESELNLDGGSHQNFLPYQLYLENLMYVGSKDAKEDILKSKFFRSVKFTEVTDDSITFEVKMQWKEGVKTRELKERDTIYNYI